MGSGNICEPIGINDLGDIVGVANSVSGGQPRGFLWRNGSFTDLGSLIGPSAGASTARDINNSGLIDGTSNSGIAVVWRNGVIETLPALAGGTTYNFVTDLNNNGDVVGYGQSPSGVHMDTPILWRNGTIDFGRWPVGTFSRAYGMNDNGQIVGEGNLVDGGPVQALIWTVSTTTPTNTAPAVTLVATSATTIMRGGIVTVLGSFADR